MSALARMQRARQTLIGLGLAAAIIIAWAALHVWGVLFWRPTPLGWACAPW